MFREKQAVALRAGRMDEIAAAALGVGDNWAAGGQGFDGGDAERFEAREEISARVSEMGGESGGVKPRDKSD